MRDWLSHRAQIDPDGEALVVAATGDVYTFGNLDTLVDDLAGRLAAAGVEPGTHLGAVLDTRLEYVCLIHAAMRLGVTLVPMGESLTARELAGQIETADVSTVVCSGETEATVVDAVVRAADGRESGNVESDGGEEDAESDGGEEDAEGASDAEDPGSDSDAEDGTSESDARDTETEDDGATDDVGGTDTRGSEMARVLTVDEPRTEVAAPLSGVVSDPVSPAEWSLDDRQLVLFTSGTTGDPKAVQLTTGNLLSSAVASVFRLGFDPDDRWLVTLSLHHMGGIAPVLRMPLYGMTVVFREGFDAGAAADDLERYEATAVSLVPTMLRRMLDRRGTLSESLRVVLLGGAPASTDLIERCRNYSVPVYPTYGMTETASQIATARPREAFANPETVGRPLFLTQVTVVDGQGTPLPSGESGELVVDGPTVTPGYYDNAAANAESFGPFGFHTGDVGVLDDRGALTVLNRVDDRIVTGGENVDPGEVVDVLRSHPDVREAAVVGVPDAQWGERVSAMVVPEADAIDRTGLLEFARERLAGFKLPKTLAVSESLPRTVSGTVDREAVRDALSDAGERSDEPGGEAQRAPAATTEADGVEDGDADSRAVDSDDGTDDSAETGEPVDSGDSAQNGSDGADAEETDRSAGEIEGESDESESGSDGSDGDSGRGDDYDEQSDAEDIDEDI
ncbi:AMP-binding protein [Halobellus rarus]|uniref:AMP-binding protein n=1 Tax=Halobellus rarus TaxID=1126237 RepID=A0ABD6CPL4_9EURY|nr:AMP-binding protein [Halobellus rarus]